MTNFIVNSPQTLLTGTTGNDLFQLQTSLAVSLFGIEGADEFSSITGQTLTQAILNGGAGNDTVNLTAIGGTLGSILGGGGTDLVSATISGSTKLLIQGGGDADTINFLFSASQSTIAGNGGNDLISGVLDGGSANRLFLGGGDDTLQFTAKALSASTIQGGGGNDFISGTISGAAFGDVVIAGDTELTQGEFDGNDTIVIASGASFINGLIQGNGGNDSIDFGGLGQGVTVGGNAGNDTVSISAATNALRTQVNMGGGVDFISATLSGGNQDLSLNGGGGNDTIFVSASGATLSAFIFGDDGADVINLGGSAAETTGIGVFVGYNAASESNLSAFDTFSARGFTGSGWTISENYINGTFAATSNSTITVGNSGAAVFTATYALGVQARVEGLNSILTTSGAVAYFADGLGSQYVFVQGGNASSTSDDLLVKNGTGTISGLTLAARGAGLIGSTIGVEI
jgi:hypothetical protein